MPDLDPIFAKVKAAEALTLSEWCTLHDAVMAARGNGWASEPDPDPTPDSPVEG